MLLALAIGTTAFARPDEASAIEPNRRGGQAEGMIGGAACIPGHAPCHQSELLFDGTTLPSFGTGFAIGARPVRWFMLGGIYRFGMFNPRYDVGDGPDYRWAGQHTVGFLMRPILPIWRFDLGFNIAPGYSRQIFRLDAGHDRDISQGFAMLIGPTFDIFLTTNFFIGAGVDFIFNTQRKSCQVRGGATMCSVNSQRRIAPTHQVLFGLRLGGTFG
jgi:hypothetical protein